MAFCQDHSMVVKSIENLEAEVKAMHEAQTQVVTALNQNTAAIQAQTKGPSWSIIFGAIIVTALANADKLAALISSFGGGQ